MPPLPFLKILETELKMLYTAITRARVNVFFAETKSDMSTPMFDYFKRRRVVDVVKKENSKDIEVSNVAIFGKMSTVEDWRERGKYYLHNAEGQRQKGCLRLAAKCFDKAGEEKLRDRALAYLAFVEIEQDNISSKQRMKHEQRQQLYNTAIQLLEAEDISFLDKAGLCLLQSGENERERCAEIFELYARINFFSRSKKKNLAAPSPQEQRYFSYAAKLYHQTSKSKGEKKRQNLIHAIRNFLCSGDSGDWSQASKIIQENLHFLSKAFANLHGLITPSKGMVNDPISYLHQQLHISSETIQCLRDSITNLAKVSCRMFYSQNDQRQFEVCIDALPSKNERVQILSNLNIDIDVEALLLQHPWASNQSFSERYLNKNHQPQSGNQIDVTEKLVKELISSDEHVKASEALEQRGFLLRAAEIIEKFVEKDSLKAVELRIRYIELVLSSPQWKDHSQDLKALVHSLDETCENSTKAIPEYVSTSLALLKVFLFKPRIEQYNWATNLEKLPFFWRLNAIETFTKEFGTMNFLSKHPNGFWDQVDRVIRVIDDTKQACEKLRFSRPSNEFLFAQIDSYFDLEANKLDPSQLKANLIANLKLCEALQLRKDSFSTSTKQLVLKTNMTEIYPILAGYFMHKAFTLLNHIEKYIEEECDKYKRCHDFWFKGKCEDGSNCKFSHKTSNNLHDYTRVIQVHMVILTKIRDVGDDQSFLLVGKSIFDRDAKTKINEKLRLTVQDLVSCMLENHSEVKIIQKNEISEGVSSNTIVIRDDLLEFISSSYQKLCWYKLQLFRKKEDAQELIKFFRVLGFCGNTKDSINKIDKQVQYLERHKSMAVDWERKKTDHIMRNKERCLFIRMWVWAVESCQSNIFNSITLVERILQKSRFINGRRDTMTKFDQLSLLESNAISIFALLSLRYSEVEGGPIAWMIPNRHLHQQLIGNDTTPLRGFGTPLQHIVAANCHKFFLEDLFGECVKHLELIAWTILKGDFLALSPEASHHSISQYEYVVSFVIFLCCNAIHFTLSGVDMGLQQTQAEVNKRPKLPLHGNFRSLISILRESLQKLIAFKIPCHLREALLPIPDDANFQHLQLVLERYYQISGIDTISYCSLHQTGVDSIRVDSDLSGDQFIESLSKVKFHESHDLFVDSNRNSSSFLQQSKRWEEEISTNNDISTKQIEKFSEESEKRVAAITITRNIRILIERRHRRSHNTLMQEGYFRQWKSTLRRFFLRAFEKVRQKKKQDKNTSTETEQTKLLPLNEMHNLWNDLGCSYEKRNIWRNVMTGRGPICDSLECGYCSIYSGHSALRRDWIMCNYPKLPINESVKIYNNTFNVPQAVAIPHSWEQHSMNFQAYNQHVENFANLASRLDISRTMLGNMIDICKVQGVNSWYSNVAEEINIAIMSLEERQRSLWELLDIWPLENYAMARFREIEQFSYEPQHLFTDQLRKEKAMVEGDLKDNSND